MRPELEALVGLVPEPTLDELSARSTDSRSLIRVAFKWSGCVDCGKAPWKHDAHIRLDQLDCDHIDPARKMGASGGVTNGRRVPGGGQDLYSFFVELLMSLPRCKECHDKLRGVDRRSGEGQLLLFGGTGEAWRLNGH